MAAVPAPPPPADAGDVLPRIAPHRDGRRPAIGPAPPRRGRPGPTLGDLAELVRLPAVLSVPGDTLLGAAAAGVPLGPVGIVGHAAASSCLYLGGMALNDYADREVDAVERPHRPIPSGRVHPLMARLLAEALTATGIAVAGLTGGRRALRVAIPLAATVWAYDLALKDTLAGPATMAACRGLDVMLGASGGDLRPALGPAAVVAAHTLAVTRVSRHEAHGASPGVARSALGSTAAVSAAAAASIAPPVLRTIARGVSRSRGSTTVAELGAVAVPGALLGAYAVTMGRAAVRALREPSPDRLQGLVGAGVLALMPLEGALIASRGLVRGPGRGPGRGRGRARGGTEGDRRRPVGVGLAVAALWPVARSLARRRAVT